MDDYWDNLLRRLFGLSLKEKGVYLQIELDRLENERSDVLHLLQVLRNQSREHQLMPQRIHRVDTILLPFGTSDQPPLQGAAWQSQQQLYASLGPWIQQAAQTTNAVSTWREGWVQKKEYKSIKYQSK
jgi:hypothetical protein